MRLFSETHEFIDLLYGANSQEMCVNDYLRSSKGFN